ncbi:hypothetical protein [Fonticella tunisiensis]|uniref:Uncharacterized protein n=1 Tax=Fonticella tunisiensis TaxID=1096341 RepID=A0A4R7KQV7_9CLOT|nr:hypothetical protein [Fonticella tunisiensis]TDT60983.1 hypothetical protein EDD71_110101 [Fonticella tunisiensis]
MKHNKLKISKIVDELMNYFFSKGAFEMNIDVKETPEYYRICFKSRGAKLSREEVKRFDKLLRYGKREEMEEYYWFLAGDSDVDTELSLVGMMTDETKVVYDEENGIEVILYRYKEGVK